MVMHRRLFQVISFIVIITILFSGLPFAPVAAQGNDGLKRQVNPQTGKVNFLGPENGQVLYASKALGIFIRPQDPAMALAKRFAPEFGLKDPERDLKEMKSNHSEDGRITARYQQNYQGIPVMGGELIVNTNERGDLYSMNGEVSAKLSLSVQPIISSEQAGETALQAMAKWYQKTPEDFLASEPSLWIYDESLLRSSTRPVELVWRMDVSPKESGMAVRELVLVNARTGGISMHFNQADTAWKMPEHTKRIQLASQLHNSSASDKPMAALLGVTWYVAPTGSDSNSCSTPASPCATIDEGITRSSNNDTVRVATGLYTGSRSEGIVIYKSITLSGGWDASFTAQTGTSIVDGEGLRRGIAVYDGTVTIDHFTIQNGYYNDIPGINDVGGGIFNTGTLTINNSIVRDNVSGSMGGGIVNYGTLVINNTLISDNLTGVGSCGAGGGGGIGNSQGTVILNSSTVTGNTVVCNLGGGIRNTGSNTGIPGILTINGSTVNDNHGDFAIYDTSFGTLTLNNSTVSDNEIGGMAKDFGLIAINNSTITANEYGVVVDLNAIGTAQNSIIAGNKHFDCYGNIDSAGYNLLGSSYNCMGFSPTTGDLVGTATRPINPHLTGLQDNGGPTLTHALMIGSPALDAGSPLIPGSDEHACLETDQRGAARPVGTRCDIGAYEGSVPRTPSPYVSTYWVATAPLPGTFICNQDDPNCTAGDPDDISVHKHAIGAYYFYFDKHNRDSIDNHGMMIISSTKYCTNTDCPYDNAFWNGEQIVYGEGYGIAFADDIIMHELTHGVTQYESNLFYYYQSGAINESLSDLWGEYYDQTNGSGTDTAGVRWQIGENIVVLNAIRSMSHPPAFNHPDKMSSPHYYQGEEDSGGVHTNSGINNKAVYLMVDGGIFNGKTVSALGWEKTAAIYYEVNTNLLPSGADYSDLYYALQQACTNLMGQKGITTENCIEVKDAIDAVEMNDQPASGFNTDAPYCGVDESLIPIFSDNLEAGTGNWTFNNGEHIRWQLDSSFGPYAHSGAHSLYGDDYPDQVTDATASLVPFTVPSNAYLRFAQAYGFESGYITDDPTLYHFDGGVLEYSLNDGFTWEDAGSMIDYNEYKGQIFTGTGNLLSGRSAFVGDSHGYISTRLNLASLAGQTVSFRWRIGLDEAGFDWGWWVDDIEVYTCEPPNLQVLIGGVLQGSYYVPPSGSERVSYFGMNGGSVQIASINGNSIVGAERVIYKVQGVQTSFTELMGLPDGQLDTTYWLPWYNNLGLDTQLRIGNVSNSTATVHIFIGGAELTPIEGITLLVGESARVSYPVNDGPVQIVSDQKIVAAERVIYKVQGMQTSFSEMMALPASQLDDTYWFPWYNNLGLDTQLRIANVTDVTASVQVLIGGEEMEGSPFTLEGGESRRVNFEGINDGPVQIISDQDIVAAARVIYKVNNIQTSFSEIMGLPDRQVNHTYWLPWYNNTGLDTQLRIGNVSGATATVHIFIGGDEVTPAEGITLLAGDSTRLSYPVNDGPVQIVSDEDIVAAARVIYKVNNLQTSFSEMMALPTSQLDDTYWFPWYNNHGLDTQLRFGVP